VGNAPGGLEKVAKVRVVVWEGVANYANLIRRTESNVCPLPSLENVRVTPLAPSRWNDAGCSELNAAVELGQERPDAVRYLRTARYDIEPPRAHRAVLSA